MGDPVTAGAAASALGGTGMVSAGALPGIVGGMGALAPAVNPVSASLFSGMAMPATITGIGKDLSAIGAFSKDYPLISQMGFGAAQQMLQPNPVSFAPPSQVGRGQIQPMDYMSLLNPQQQNVIVPSAISLL